MINSTKIAHIADIHIGSNSARYSEYIDVFNQFARQIAEQDVKIVVICGDVFHNKIKLTPEDIQCFYHLLNLIKKYYVVIIPGNHDTNLRNPDKLDLISPLIDAAQYPKLVYMRKSGITTLAGVNFCHLSIIDEYKIPHPCNDSGARGDYVCLTHIESGTKLNLNGFKFCCLGDLHETRIYEGSRGFPGSKSLAVYPGSLIQQNVGESMKKGYLLWDFDSGECEFHQVKNAYGYLKFDLRGVVDVRGKCDEIAKNAPEKLLGITLHIMQDDPRESTVSYIESFVKQKISKISTHPSAQGPSILAAPADTTKKFTLDCSSIAVGLSDLLGSDIDKAEILSLHEKRTIGVINKSKWSIMRVEWSNVMIYGEGNYIDFSEKKVYGLTGANMSGKSTIFDVIVYALFRETLRGNADDLININSKELMISIDIRVNDVDYKIKVIKQGKRDTVSLWKFVNSEKSIVDLTGVSIPETYKKIRSLIGTLDDFQASCFMDKGIRDFISMTKTLKRKMFIELIGLNVIEGVIAGVKEEIKLIRSKLAKLRLPVYANHESEIAKRQIEMDKISGDMPGVIEKMEKRLKFGNFRLLPSDRAKLVEELTIELENKRIEHEMSCISCVNGGISPPEGMNAELCKQNMIEAQERNFCLRNIKITPDAVERRDKIASRLKTIKSSLQTGNMRFNKNCPCCIDNAKTLSLPLESGVNQAEIDKLEQLLKSAEEQVILLAEYNEYQSNVAIINEMEQYLEWYRSSLDLVRLNELRAKIRNIPIDKYRQFKIDNFDDIVEMSQDQSDYVDMYGKMNRRLKELELEIASYRADAVYCANLDQKVLLTRELGLLVKYEEKLGGKGLEKLIIGKYIDNITEYINKMLAEFTNFTINFVEKGEELDVRILQGSTQYSADSGSGFQKFLLSILFRMSFVNILSKTGTFMMIDEGFGTMDKDNIKLVEPLFKRVIRDFDFIFVISHIEDLQISFEKQLNISTINGNAHIECGGGSQLSTYAGGGVKMVKEQAEPIKSPRAAAGLLVLQSNGMYKCQCSDKEFKAGSLKGHEKSQKHLAYISMCGGAR